MGIPFLNKVKFFPMCLVYGNQAPPEGRRFLHHFSVCAVLSHSVVLTLCNPMDSSPPGTSVHGGSPGKNTGVGCHALLQGIFPTQEWNPGLPHCRQILYHLSQQGSWWLNLSHCFSTISLHSFAQSLAISQSCFVNKFVSAYSPL